MKLSGLITENDVLLYGDIETEVFGLSHNSKSIKKGDVFFALSGQAFDGNYYIEEAVKNGASVIVTDKNVNVNIDASVIKTNNARSAMTSFASKFYNNPQNSMKIIMITGTNGKTTTSFLIQNILNDNGMPAGAIGTNGAIWGKKHISTGMTTPDPIELFKILSLMKDDGIKVVVMEASAHALVLNKLDGISSDISILTNITQDHLDFFKDMENYANAKFSLFCAEKTKSAVVCIDDDYTIKLFNSLTVPAISCGVNKDAIIKAENVEQTNSGQNFVCNINGKKQKYAILLDGEFNVKNALCAISACSLLGIKEDNIKDSLKTIAPVAGRFNKIDKNGVMVVIDYAHTPDGIFNVIVAGRKLAKENKLYVVFGCGGLRDDKKRPIMGEIACENADYVYITSDNPRQENPSKIISDIISGAKNKNNFVAIEDRKTAIETAISNANKGDVVMILGKGCEDYMEINGQKIPYSDYSVVNNYMPSAEDKQKS
ncbi:MAG: UDP-N-acetylmuramoyl-L-alanyl-D-glutamate--2,6-diaminopimelate ligase [Clostridia bacterium]|nr:UDP-N-acetylmuramoyl-L-alanyl-D-glutamate--2,6-diaminopimelate ligase [Clostridia bacterium]